MGILFQHSCYRQPDARLVDQATGKAKKSAKQPKEREKLEKRRRNQLDGIIEEARVWIYALLIPTHIIANGDPDIKRELDNQISEITTELLGTKITLDKVNAICGKIARNILVPGTGNLDPGHAYPTVPDYNSVRYILDSKFIKASFLQIINDNCTNFRTNHPDARTWYEIRLRAGSYTLDNEPLLDVLDRWQHDMTFSELGVPFAVNWRLAAEKIIYDKMQAPDQVKVIYGKVRSTDPTKLKNFKLVQRDLILIRAGNGQPSNPRLQADLQYDYNLMTLHSRFWQDTSTGPDSLREVSMRPGQNRLHDILTRVLVMLHEITHSVDVNYTDDHSFVYETARRNRIDWLPADSFVPVPSKINTYSAYGLEACIGLARRDKRNNTNKAEDNADSWAFYFAIRVLLLAYPDVDIAGALRTCDVFDPQVRLLEENVELLHHCSLLWPLRHATAGDLTDPARHTSIAHLVNGSVTYDPSKDYFAPVPMVPRTMAEILKIAQDVDTKTQNWQWSGP